MKAYRNAPVAIRLRWFQGPGIAKERWTVAANQCHCFGDIWCEPCQMEGYPMPERIRQAVEGREVVHYSVVIYYSGATQWGKVQFTPSDKSKAEEYFQSALDQPGAFKAEWYARLRNGSTEVYGESIRCNIR